MGRGFKTNGADGFAFVFCAGQMLRRIGGKRGVRRGKKKKEEKGGERWRVIYRE